MEKQDEIPNIPGDQDEKKVVAATQRKHYCTFTFCKISTINMSLISLLTSKVITTGDR